ncbi:MAG TPA: polysaccharide biosynthesis protein [Clostridiaceae bacterium]
MKEQSTTKGFAILSAAGIIVKVMSIFYIFILIKIIGPTGYGHYLATYTIFVFVYIIINSGIPAAISKFIAELLALGNFRDAVKTFKLARTILVLAGTVCSLILILSSGWISKASGQHEIIKLSLILLSPSILFTAVASAYRGFFQGKGNMNPTAVSQIIEQFLNTTLSLLFAFLWRNQGMEYYIAGATVGTTIGAFFSAVYLIIICNKSKALKPPKGRYEDLGLYRYTNKQLVRRLLSYALPISTCFGLQSAGTIVDLANIESRLQHGGIGYDQSVNMYGYLGKFQILINVPITIITALSATILPKISRYHTLDDRKAVKEGVNYAFKTCLLIAIPSAIGLAALSYPIFELLFPSVTNGAYLMEIGSITLVLMALVQIQATLLQSVGKFYLATFYIILGILVKIALNYILVANKSININGAIIGTIVGFAIPVYFNNKLIKEAFRIKYSLLKIAYKPFLAALVMGIVGLILRFLMSIISSGYIIKSLMTIITVVISVIVYSIALIIFGGITKNDMDKMPLKVRRRIPAFLSEKLW